MDYDEEEKGPRRIIKFIHSIAKDGVINFKVKTKPKRDRSKGDV